jgi:glycosyltransferase involved in cell wall biosynthesis
VSTAEFSLLLPVYRRDDPAFLARAFASAVDEQTLRPSEVVVVRDGPVGKELAIAIERIRATSPVPVTLVEIAENQGLANALTQGLRACAHELVARMDADDIALPARFATQVPLMAERGLDILGTGMLEFSDDPARVLGRRRPPVGQANIERYARFHDPFNHPTVLYRRSAVERAGGYRPLGLMEDYWLFARMIAAGARVDNVPEPLVLYRVGAGAYSRRGGVAQFKAEVALQREFRLSGFTTRPQAARNLLIRAGYRLVPMALRRAAYRRLIAPGGVHPGGVR